MGDGWRALPFRLGATLAVALAIGCADPGREALDRGDIALALRRATDAEAAYLEALALRPESADAMLGLARAQAADGRYEQALGRYRALAERHPERFEAVHDREYCRVLLATAREHLQHATAEHALARANRGLAEACPQPEFAALRDDAKSAQAVALQRAGELERAAVLQLEVAESDPARVAAWQAAGELFLVIGHKREALRVLSEALRHHPRDPALKELMVDALAGSATAPRDD
jgi:tetratricopeptide (TPR) repeat protein